MQADMNAINQISDISCLKKNRLSFLNNTT